MIRIPASSFFIQTASIVKCEGLNIRYLSYADRFAFFGMMRQLLGIGGGAMQYNGRMLYEIIKRHYYRFAQVAYRKYFSVYMTGIKVSEGLAPVTPLMELYYKTQNLVATSTSNYMEMKAKADPVVREVNAALFDRRAQAYKSAEYKNYSGRTAATPPGAVTPGQVPTSTARSTPTPGQPGQPGGAPAGPGGMPGPTGQ